MRFSTASALAAFVAPALAVYHSNTTQDFLLRVSVTSGNQALNGQYVAVYQTDQYTGNAIVQSGTDAASAFFVNGTLDGGKYTGLGMDSLVGPTEPWSVIPGPGDNLLYYAWQAVGVNFGGAVPTSTSAFFTNSSGLQWTSTPGNSDGMEYFGGWCVCDWWFAEPQLFFRQKFFRQYSTLPSGCAEVTLTPEYI